MVDDAIAERAARDWVGANAPTMEFCSVNPVAVLGPVASSDFAASVETFEQLLSGKVPACPDVGFCIVDTRDVAAVIQAVSPELGVHFSRTAFFGSGSLAHAGGGAAGAGGAAAGAAAGACA